MNFVRVCNVILVIPIGLLYMHALIAVTLHSFRASNGPKYECSTRAEHVLKNTEHENKEQDF